MSDHVNITLSSNAGLIMEYRGTKLFLDGICGVSGYPFSDLGESRWEQLMSATPPYDGIDYLLFTHNHGDHFSPELTLTYLQKHPAKHVFLPEGAQLLAETLTQTGIACTLPSAMPPMTEFAIGDDIVVRAFPTRHLDKQFWDVPHQCYLISFGEKHVLFTADADYTLETFEQVQDYPLRAVFLNPMFFGALCRGRFFKGKLTPETFCVYHIPFSPDDTMGMRPVLAQALLAWPAEKPEVRVFSEPFQNIIL